MKDLVEKIVNKLANENKTISFAESCTGGRVASEFTAISGVSSVLNGSCVTYSNNIKSLWLGVKESTLIDFGAVSRECVEEMLIGIRDKAFADCTIAVSGIAGPKGGTEFKPVGTVYIGVLTPNGSFVKLYNFNGSREDIQKQATQKAIENMAKELNL